MKKMTIKDLENLAKTIPNYGILVQTLQNLPNIDFEMVETQGEDIKYVKH